MFQQTTIRLSMFCQDPWKVRNGYAKAEKKTFVKSVVYFQAVHPNIVLNALNQPNINNPLYNGIEVNGTNIHESLSELYLQISSQKDSQVCPISDKNSEQRTTHDENEEEREDPSN